VENSPSTFLLLQKCERCPLTFKWGSAKQRHQATHEPLDEPTEVLIDDDNHRHAAEAPFDDAI